MASGGREAGEAPNTFRNLCSVMFFKFDWKYDELSRIIVRRPMYLVGQNMILYNKIFVFCRNDYLKCDSECTLGTHGFHVRVKFKSCHATY